ncbi:bacterio-opsin activator [Halobacteriales archaeon QS_4_69_34]|nr:MAG: bacterio-opsin activator [Halobacteriales archaeon QS_4_69_34]
MRYAEFTLVPEGGWFHPFDRVVAEELEVTREAIHHMKLLNDGTAVMLYEFSGEYEQVERMTERYYGSMVHQLSRLGDNALVYARFEPNETVAELLSIPEDYEIVLDTPMVLTDRGELRIRLIGDERAIRRAMGAIPANIGVTMEATGEYKPGSERLFMLLTERQRETLKTAVELGYYRDPREATYEDIAAALGRTAGTVGEHLRKAEVTLMREIVPTSE